MGKGVRFDGIALRPSGEKTIPGSSATEVKTRLSTKGHGDFCGEICSKEAGCALRKFSARKRI
jgi:hypothetical protein